MEEIGQSELQFPWIPLIKRDYSLSENILGDPVTARRHVQSSQHYRQRMAAEVEQALAQILAKDETCNFVFRMDR